MSGANKQDKTRLAALVYLSRVLDDLSLPIRLAEDWICPAGLPEFIEEIDKKARALAAFIDDYLEKHSLALVEDEEDNGGTARILEVQLADAKKNLDFLNRIGKAGTGVDAGKSTAEIVREEIKKAATDAGKPTSAIGREEIKGAAVVGSATDFAAEAEELRKLRAGELKIKPPSKEPQP